ncbi:MAG: HEAT repeat domain-containing protein [Chloroflexia bacterium]
MFFRKSVGEKPPPTLPSDPAHWSLGTGEQREHLLSLLLRELDSPLPSRRERAVELLAESGEEQVLPALVSLARRETNPMVRWKAFQAISRLAGEAVGSAELPSPEEVAAWRDEALADLLGRLESEQAGRRWEAAEGLGDLGDPRAVPALVRALRDPHAFVRWAAAQAIGRIGGEEAVVLLLPLLQERDPLVRRSAADALGYLDAPAVRQALRRALRDPDPTVRRNAVEAVARLGDREAVGILAAVLTSSDDLWVRYSAAEALGMVGDHRAIAALIEAAQDRQVLLRRAAVRSLGRLHDSRVITPLVRALRDPDAQVRLHAVEGLGRLGHEMLIPELERLLQDTASVFGQTVGEEARRAIEAIRSRTGARR